MSTQCSSARSYISMTCEPLHYMAIPYNHIVLCYIHSLLKNDSGGGSISEKIYFALSAWIFVGCGREKEKLNKLAKLGDAIAISKSETITRMHLKGWINIWSHKEGPVTQSQVDKDHYGFDHDVGDGRDFYVANANWVFLKRLLEEKSVAVLLRRGGSEGATWGLIFSNCFTSKKCQPTKLLRRDAK